MILFALATLSPVLLILVAIGWGGIWAWIAVASVTILAFSLDRLTPEEIENVQPDMEFPASEPLLVLLGALHLSLLFAAVWAVGGDSGLPLLDRGLIGAATALYFGQISHPVGHELIHRPARALRLLGQVVYTSMLFGHHASAHLRVHHVNVGSAADPNSARLGEGFYGFALRAWPAGFIAGLRAENRLRRGRTAWRHPYFWYIVGALGFMGIAFGLAGVPGISALVLIGVYAQLQILMSDYVQHYGLQRHPMADGRLEPIGPQHSWNAPHWFTSAMSLNAPRHSDHHVSPSRPFPALQLDEDKMPCLPYSLPVMAGIALIPPLWRRVMDPRCVKWLPVWIERTETDTRNISPAVLSHAKSGGMALDDLASLAHVPDRTPSLPDTQQRGSPRRRPDDGR